MKSEKPEQSVLRLHLKWAHIMEKKLCTNIHGECFARPKIGTLCIVGTNGWKV